MLHVWVVPYPGGPFSDDLSRAAASAAAPGRPRPELSTTTAPTPAPRGEADLSARPPAGARRYLRQPARLAPPGPGAAPARSRIQDCHTPAVWEIQWPNGAGLAAVFVTAAIDQPPPR